MRSSAGSGNLAGAPGDRGTPDPAPSLEAGTLRADLASLSGSARLGLASILLLTLLVCLLWSHFRLLWADELLEFYTDSKPSLSAVLWGQLHAPFSFEPPAFHLLLHLLVRVFPSPELALRLPSIVALVVTEAAVFAITLRICRSEAAALIAAVLPLCLVTITYGPEGRIYSVLTASFAVALLCWQLAAGRSSNRTLPLIGFTAALGTAVLVHYYGISLLLPLALGELVRTVRRKRLDRPMLGCFAIVIGLTLLNLPFQRALAPIRHHYFADGQTAWSMIPLTYAWFVFRWQAYGFSAGTNLFIFCVLALLLAIGVTWRLRSRHLASQALWVWTALLAAASLPVLNVVISQFTRAYVPRYSLPATVGLCVLVASLLSPRPVRGPESAAASLPLHRAALWAVFAVLLFVGGRSGLHQINDNRATGILERRHAAAPSITTLPPGVADPHIYIQQGAAFLEAFHYAPPALQSRVVLVRSRSCELRWMHSDSGEFIVSNIHRAAGIPIADFTPLQHSGTPHLFVLVDNRYEDWLRSELQAEHAITQTLGPVFGGELVQATLSPANGCGDDHDSSQP